MLLKHVYLAIDFDDPILERHSSDFQFQTRALCNFVERRIRPLRFTTTDFSKICVFGTTNSPKPSSVRPESALVSHIPFELAPYQLLAADQRQELFGDMLRAGFAACAQVRKIPLQELLAAIDAFRASGFVNQWIHTSKLLRPFKIKAQLWCDLTMDRFVLTLVITRSEIEICRFKVLETKPDEIIFQHQFKEVAVVDSHVVVLDRFGNKVFSQPIDEILGRT